MRTLTQRARRPDHHRWVPPQHPVLKLREVELGLASLAADVEAQLGTRAANLLHWRQEVREVIAELEGRRWTPTGREDPGHGWG